MQNKFHYSKWKTEKGVAIKVTPLKFLNYYKINNSIHTFKIGKKTYQGQIWKCKKEGKTCNLTFRIEVAEIDVKSFNVNTSLISNKNPLPDIHPNPLVDSREECELGIINKDLFPPIELRKVYLKILYQLRLTNSEFRTLIIIRLNLIDNCSEINKWYNYYNNLNSKKNMEDKRQLKNLIQKEYELLYRK